MRRVLPLPAGGQYEQGAVKVVEDLSLLGIGTGHRIAGIRSVNQVSESGQLSHFNISRISSRMWLDLAMNSFAILALGAHQIVVQLEAEPEAGRAWVLRMGGWMFFHNAGHG